MKDTTRFILIVVEAPVTNASTISVSVDGKEVNSVPITIEKDDYFRTTAESLGVIVQKCMSKFL